MLYLLDLGDGRALAVDPSLDLRAVRTAADRAGLAHRVRGRDPPARRLPVRRAAARPPITAPQILASAAGDREFRTRGCGDGDEVDLGGLTLRALATPGHTPEHLSFLLLDGRARSGCSPAGRCIVGAAARTDLVGAGAHRGAGPRPVPVAAAPCDAARRHRGVADPRRGLVLLRAARRRPDLHDRRARRPPTRCSPPPTRTRSSRCCSAGPGQLPDLLRPTGRAQPPRPARPGRADGLAPLMPASRAPAAGRRRR